MRPTPHTFTTSNLRPIVSALVIATLTASCAVLANAQMNTAADAEEVSETTPLGETPVSSTTVAPLTSTFQPSTPWPAAATNISATTLEAPRHNLLTYSGVEAAARKLLGDNYPTWQKQLESDITQQTLPSGLLAAGGCIKPCEMHKSLLVVNPSNYRVYAAMVAEGRVLMWPSLMSWPDEAIPTLKTWLADATNDEPESK